MKRIATCGGYQLYEEGPRLVFLNRGTGCFGIATYVAGLIGLVTGGNGVVWLVNGAPVPAAVLLVVCAASVCAAVFMWKHSRSVESAPPSIQSATVVVDREKLVITDGAGRVLGPLEGASFQSVFQAASSSRALELSWRGGSEVVARGSPFTGSIEAMVAALASRGMRVG